MRKLMPVILAVIMLLTLSVTAFADGHFTVEDGYIVGTYEADGFIEIRVNDEGAGAGMDSVTIKVAASGDGNDDIQVYVDGELKEAYIDGETVAEEDFDSVPEPEYDPVITPEPTPEPASEPGNVSGNNNMTIIIIAVIVVIIAAVAAILLRGKKNGKEK